MKTNIIRTAALLLLGCLLPLLSSGSAWAQDLPDPPRPPAFVRLFPQPTGTNGYEECVQAGDLIRNSTQIDEAREPGATLTFKRHLLADANVTQALRLLRVGLNKPIQTPHTLQDEGAAFPELSAFLKLGDLLAIEQYVRFAGGNGDGAIESFYDGLRFGYLIQAHYFNAGLRGIVITARVLSELSSHLDQLSAYECSRVQRHVEEWLTWPSPAAEIIRNSRQDTLQRLEKQRGKSDALLELVTETSAAGEKDPMFATLIRSFINRPNQPRVIGEMIDRAEFLINDYYEAVLANRKLPAEKRVSAQLRKENSLGSLVAAGITGNIEYQTEAYDHLEAQIRLMGVHAAIRAYRWEYDHLPNTLAELHLGRLGLDPFTGVPLFYQRTGTHYDLYSAGPKGRAVPQEGKPLSTPRQAIRVDTNS